jgi:delta 1-pyrroline-5-carboxylate dehydrogenase
LDPADRRRVIGSVREAEPEAVKAALAAATAAAPGWESSPAGDRAACLDRAVDPLEGVCPELMALCVREAGKTIPDDLAEVREAVDFCRYYTTGYGLTLGIHSRVDDFAQRIHARLRVGNTYVNRNMIGAAVGVQPFGGEGLSGTGPKAGDPRYLHRFATERTLTVNTAAAGGNAALLSLEEDDT